MSSSSKAFHDQVETDAMVTGYARALEYYHLNRTKVLGAAAGLAGVVVLGIGYTWYADVKGKEAASVLMAAELRFTNGDFAGALNGGNGVVGLADIVDQYGSTDAGNLARYYAAVSALRTGDAETALAYIEDFDSPEGIMGVSAMALHASLLEAAGRHADAVSRYVAAAEADLNEGTTPLNLLKAAEAAQRAGDAARTRQLAQRVVDEYPSSTSANAARRLLGAL